MLAVAVTFCVAAVTCTGVTNEFAAIFGRVVGDGMADGLEVGLAVGVGWALVVADLLAPAEGAADAVEDLDAVALALALALALTEGVGEGESVGLGVGEGETRGTTAAGSAPPPPKKPPPPPTGADVAGAEGAAVSVGVTEALAEGVGVAERLTEGVGVPLEEEDAEADGAAEADDAIVISFDSAEEALSPTPLVAITFAVYFAGN